MRPTILLAALVASAAPAPAAEDRRPNVLFLAVDDLRPRLSCFGVAGIHSPNLDRLAAEGVRFERAYCMVPVCGASRASLMTGLRPTRDRFVGYRARADEDAPDATTLNAHFRDQGYHTVSLGKVFHVPEDSAGGWSETPWRPAAETYRDPENRRIAREHRDRRGRHRGPAFEAADVPDDAYADGRLAERAVADLRRLGAMDRPFFLAVGFFKPHLPFVAPRKYWDLYDPERIAMPPNADRPEDAPDEAIHNWGELRTYAGIPESGPLPDEMARTLIRGYNACVSYTDAQIGAVLDELDRLGLSEETIVVLWGDHGWNLGEHTLWCKHCCFETSMRAPLIVRAPGVEGGASVTALTEFLDIYPTLCDLASLPRPDHLQGRSLVPLLMDPGADGPASAVGRYTRGDTIRTDRYRYTEYTDDSGRVTARMLYDHRDDPGETVNIVATPEGERVVPRLSERLRRRP